MSIEQVSASEVLEDLLHSEDLAYLIDEDLKLIWVNNRWIHFAEENHGEHLVHRFLNGEVIHALSGFSGCHRERWEKIYDELINNSLSEYTESFTCPAPEKRRTYKLTVSPFYKPDHSFHGLLHRSELISEQEQPMEEVEQENIYVKTFSRALFNRSEQSDVQRVDAQGLIRPIDYDSNNLVWFGGRQTDKPLMLISETAEQGAIGQRACRILSDLLAIVDDHEPTGFMEQLNQLYSKQVRAATGHQVSFTGMLMQADLEDGTLYSVAFGSPGFLCTRKAVDVLKSGPPLGLIPGHEKWPLNCHSLSELGRRVLAFTDGVVEQFDIDGHMFGVDELYSCWKECDELRLSDALLKIIEFIDDFRGEALIKDDQALLGLEFSDRPPSSDVNFFSAN